MKRNHRLVAAAALAAGLGFATAAAADCAAELESLSGVSKDGSAAPLAESATPQTGGMMNAENDDAAKDADKGGNEMPMGANPDVAMSAEDAQAQSQGGETAAAQAMGGNSSGADGGRQAAIDEAHAALAAGDEEACMAAVERAKSM